MLCIENLMGDRAWLDSIRRVQVSRARGLNATCLLHWLIPLSFLCVVCVFQGRGRGYWPRWLDSSHAPTGRRERYDTPLSLA